MPKRLITCPGCRTKMEVEAEIGARFPCPSCQYELRFGAEPKPAPAAAPLPTQPVRAIPVTPATAQANAAPSQAIPVVPAQRVPTVAARPVQPVQPLQAAAPTRRREVEDDYPPVRRRRNRSGGDSDRWVGPVIVLGILVTVLLIAMVAVSTFKSNELAKNPPPPTRTEAPPPVYIPPPKAIAKEPEKKPAPAADPLNLTDADLAHLKAATVFVKLPNSSGSGFVVTKKGSKCTIVTNKHVVEEHDFSARALEGGDEPGGRDGEGKKKKSPPKRRGLPPINAAGIFGGLAPGEEFDGPGFGIAREVDVVFRAGTEKQQRRKGKVVLAEEDVDLALVEVEGVQDPPEPIEIAPSLELRELQPVFAFGFPFGDQLLQGSEKTAITVTAGKVSSIRIGAGGVRDSVHFDTTINPGNSGGPLVDGKRRLVGVNTLLDTKNRIGIALAHSKVMTLLKPRVGTFRVAVSPFSPAPTGPIATRVRLTGASDWKEVKLIYSQVREGNPRDKLIDEDGAKEIVLKVNGDVANGAIADEEIDRDMPLYCQAVAIQADGTESRTRSRLSSLRLGGPRKASELKGGKGVNDWAFSRGESVPFGFLNYDFLEKKIRPPRTAPSLGNSHSVSTGLGARFNLPHSGSNPTVCAFGQIGVRGEKVAAFAVVSLKSDDTVYAGGSVHVEGSFVSGLRQSDVQRFLLDAFKEFLGPMIDVETVDFAPKVKGKGFVISPLEKMGGFDPEDPPSLRVATVASKSAVHVIAQLRRHGKAGKDPQAEDFFSSFHAEEGSMEVPSNALIFDPAMLEQK